MRFWARLPRFGAVVALAAVAAVGVSSCRAVRTVDVRGTVTSRGAAVVLPATAVLTVRLDEIVHPDSAPRTLVLQRVSLRGRQLPVSFELSTLKTEIAADRAHQVVAHVDDDTRELLHAESAAPVLTRGARDNATIYLVATVPTREGTKGAAPGATKSPAAKAPAAPSPKMPAR
jgi:uncharacterized lipoprotein YbaY